MLPLRRCLLASWAATHATAHPSIRLFPYLLLNRGLAAPSPAGAGIGGGKKLKGKGVAAISTKKEHEVETDTAKLASHLCINYLVDGEFTPLKPMEDYPDWLHEISTEMNPRPLHELEPDSEAYWSTVIAAKMKEAYKLGKMDGWIKAEHMREENHLERFYGDVYHEVESFLEAGGSLEKSAASKEIPAVTSKAIPVATSKAAAS